MAMAMETYPQDGKVRERNRNKDRHPKLHLGRTGDKATKTIATVETLSLAILWVAIEVAIHQHQHHRIPPFHRLELLLPMDSPPPQILHLPRRRSNRWIRVWKTFAIRVGPERTRKVLQILSSVWM
jgi:hypothetical protein